MTRYLLDEDKPRGPLLKIIHECFDEVKRLSDVPYPKYLTILNPVSNDMFVIIEGSTKVLKMIDT